MTSPAQHHGVIVPMVTPFTADGRLDEAAAERIVARLVENQINVFVLGTTGEAASIPIPARRRLVEIAVSLGSGKVRVYAGIGGNCVADSIDAAREYHRAGVDAVVAHLPSYYLLDGAEMQAYFESLVHACRSPLLLYNIPQATRMSLPVDVVERLAAHSEIVGFKDSENAPGRMESVLEKLGGRRGFSLFMGAAVLSAKAMRAGFHGVVPSSGNLAPDLWRDFYTAACAGDWPRTEELQTRLNDVALVFQQGRSLGQSLAALKAAMQAGGLCGPTVLPPLRTLSPSECAAVEEKLRALVPA